MDFGNLFQTTYTTEKFTFFKSSMPPASTPPTFDVEILSSPSAATDFDKTGEVVWPVSVLLAQFLLSYAGLRARIEDSEPTSPLRILELGSGVGLPSAAVLEYYAGFKNRISLRASDGHEAFITTGEGEAGILSRNLEKYEQNAKAIPLLWGKTQDVLNALPSYDVLFAADVVQWPAVVEPLAMTVHALLHPGKGAEPKKRPVMYLGIVERDDGALKQKFFALLCSYGFSEARQIKYEEYLPRVEGEEGGSDEAAAFTFPAKGAEFGGRICMIYEIELIDFDMVPVLLEAGVTDKLLSSGHEQTMTLPCVNASFS
ncbi:hypothetical protein TrLO_g2283 [Triparma laevis f. longispina]|uniref:Uncharacterized protein n=1 Tax=Triparma laevis f. longispina TaxID=1714387 RepID=A0A9W7AA41_9STRA|nr:hypothetical protein TrLO_g2283 [Triparma laevis f. longispina]